MQKRSIKHQNTDHKVVFETNFVLNPSNKQSHTKSMAFSLVFFFFGEWGGGFCRFEKQELRPIFWSILGECLSLLYTTDQVTFNLYADKILNSPTLYDCGFQTSYVILPKIFFLSVQGFDFCSLFSFSPIPAMQKVPNLCPPFYHCCVSFPPHFSFSFSDSCYKCFPHVVRHSLRYS